MAAVRFPQWTKAIFLRQNKLVMFFLLFLYVLMSFISAVFFFLFFRSLRSQNKPSSILARLVIYSKKKMHIYGRIFHVALHHIFNKLDNTIATLSFIFSEMFFFPFFFFIFFKSVGCQLTTFVEILVPKYVHLPWLPKCSQVAALFSVNFP